jgi:hypothetical protein
MANPSLALFDVALFLALGTSIFPKILHFRDPRHAQNGGPVPRKPAFSREKRIKNSATSKLALRAGMWSRIIQIETTPQPMVAPRGAATGRGLPRSHRINHTDRRTDRFTR